MILTFHISNTLPTNRNGTPPGNRASGNTPPFRADEVISRKATVKQAKLECDAHYLTETKGLEDITVDFKDRPAHRWCENASVLTGTPWAYVKVLQKEAASLQPEDFAALLVLRKDLAG